MDYKNLLNHNQLEAVETKKQYVRVIAGAGSGKTRVLTYRIAYLIEEMGVNPWNILAITFTNKVANEMKNRVASLVPGSSKYLTIKTFHSFAAYFLRREITVLGYPQTFTILDEEDTTKLIKDIAVELGYKRGDAIVKKAISFIGTQKLYEKYPEDLDLEAMKNKQDGETLLEIYERYEAEKKKTYSLDFDDLLLYTNIILENNPMIRYKWQEMFDFILIDEFQDTNNTEYRLLKFLMKPDTSLYVVGDPDQTIYTWRGANQKIILNLTKDYPSIKDIVLDRNYRSSQNILDAANKLIAHNRMRVPKNLYTENDKGMNVMVRGCNTSRSEADYVVRTIKDLVKNTGYSYSDIVILYRSSYVTQEFEQAFVQANIPYVIYGGLKFYQRKEIKDVLAYFRLVVNYKDNSAFDRIINVPRRGIGEKNIDNIKFGANSLNLSIYEYIKQLDEKASGLSHKAITSLKSLILVIDKVREDISNDSETFSKILENFIIQIGYYDYLAKEEDGDERLENVKALFADLRHYLYEHPESTFDEYLQNIALISAQDEMSDGERITLMTAHTAKGLEFPVVFIVRLNSSVFPHNRALTEGGFEALEEERRLCYVAMTRAKERLYLSCTFDYSYVTRESLTPSQFFKEAGFQVRTNPRESYFFDDKPKKEYHFDDIYTSTFETKPKPKPVVSNIDNGIYDWAVGDIVIHDKFGRGEVIELEGDNIIRVRFEQAGCKSILGNHKAVKKGGHTA